MSTLIACGMCGGDAATDTMLVQAALAGVLSVPFFFREHAHRFVRRLRGMPDPAAESCPITPNTNDEA